MYEYKLNGPGRIGLTSRDRAFYHIDPNSRVWFRDRAEGSRSVVVVAVGSGRAGGGGIGAESGSFAPVIRQRTARPGSFLRLLVVIRFISWSGDQIFRRLASGFVEIGLVLSVPFFQPAPLLVPSPGTYVRYGTVQTSTGQTGILQVCGPHMDTVLCRSAVCAVGEPHAPAGSRHASHPWMVVWLGALGRRWCRPGASVVTSIRRPAAPLRHAVLVWLFSAERSVPGGVRFSWRSGEQLCWYFPFVPRRCCLVGVQCERKGFVTISNFP